MRELALAEYYIHVAALCYLCSVFQCIGGIREKSAHLFLALYIELPALIAHAVLVADLCLGLDTEQHIMRLRILCIGIVAVVGSHQRDVQLPADRHQLHVYQALCRYPVILKLQEIIARAEGILKPLRLRPGIRELPPLYHPGQRSRQARR